MNKTMKAARLHKVGEALRIDEVPVPEVGPGEILVNVKAAIIDGTNLHLRAGRFPTPKLPVILGNETSGVVAAVGKGVSGFKEGDRVLVNCIIGSCGSCYFCKSGNENICPSRNFFGCNEDGSFAEYIKVPSINAFHISNSIPFDQAAVLSDAAATAYHAIDRGNIKPGYSVAVYGIGGVGSIAIQMARLYGASKVIAIDINDKKLEIAKELGADYLINSQKEDPVAKVMKLTDNKGADVTYEMVGDKQAMEQTAQSARVGGRAIIIGLGPEKIEISPFSIILRELELTGSWGYRFTDYPTLIELAGQKKFRLDKSLSARVPLDRVNEGLDLLERDKNLIGVVVDI